MAIDSANRRFSMMNFGTQPIQPLIIPDGTVASADMYHFLTLYHGITLDSPAAPTPVKSRVGFIVNVNKLGIR